MNLVKNGIDKNIIILKIKNSNTNFDVSTDALIFLKNNNVDNDIVMEMINKSSKTIENASFENNINENITEKTGFQENNNSKEIANATAKAIIEKLNGSGIYYYNKELETFTQADQTVVSGAETKISTGNYFGVPSGVVNKNYLDGKEANLTIAETREPIFYFYFDPASTSLNNSNNKTGQIPSNYMEMIYGFSFQQNSKAFTPNDFKVIMLDIRKNSRMFKGGRNSYGLGMGKIPSSYFVTFKYERLSNNLFKVYFPKPLLKKAQFCFLYAGNTGSKDIAYANNNSEIKVFDFGTNVKKKRK